MSRIDYVSAAQPPCRTMARNPRTLWESYTRKTSSFKNSVILNEFIELSPRTRLIFGLTLGVTGLIGLVVSDRLEEILPAEKNTPQQTAVPQKQ